MSPAFGLGFGLPFNGSVPGGVATAKPVNTAVPSIFGIQTVAQTLGGGNGTWDQPVTSFAYKWQTSADGSTGWTDISGATSSTYVPVTGDIGKFLRHGVLASNSFGAAVAGYAFSVATGAIAAALTISGTPGTTATVGSAYSATLTIAGGHTPYSLNAVTNKPPWMTASLSGSTITLGGTPTGVETDAGIVVSATDNDGLTASLASFTITVSASGGVINISFDQSDADHSLNMAL